MSNSPCLKQELLTDLSALLREHDHSQLPIQGMHALLLPWETVLKLLLLAEMENEELL